ncbi:MAG: DNA helicase [Rhodospirillales bacterium 20-64-7]|nr:MAG: DNA helicase [Rhodospirillales bacterium 20-64-7]
MPEAHETKAAVAEAGAGEAVEAAASADETVEAVTEDAAIEDAADADSDARVAEDAAAEADGFAPLGLSEPLLQALHDKGYLRPTPIQAQAIPTVLMGRDVLGVAQTGTGKTAGFTLPLLDILSGSRSRARMPRSLILEPTRELALQVAENFVAYGKYLKLNHALLIGGESMSDQKEALAKGVDVLIATPGRLIDLFERGGLLLTDVRVLVIDEADRMLDMGFIPDIERIVQMLPRSRQTLFFSATMAPEIRRLADAFLSNPKEITVSKPASVATTITAGLVLVNEHDKREALRRLIRSEDVQNALIFCNRKRDVDVLLKSLLKHGFSAGALHGDLAQSVRFATLEKFKAGELRLLVCSDVAARGIDIGGLSHVFNFDVPHHAEDYVHRIGRTGRAGKEGRAFTIATPEDKFAVEAVEKLVSAAIPRIEIPGLDVVEWAEGDGRRGRGRGRAKPAGKTAGRGAKAKDEAPAERALREPREQPAKEHVAKEHAAKEQAPKEQAPKERTPRERPERAERSRDRPERDRERGRTEHSREPRGAEQDRNTVRGFGPDVPAFMLIRKRGPLSAILEDAAESEDDTNGEDMAA